MGYMAECRLDTCIDASESILREGSASCHAARACSLTRFGKMIGQMSLQHY
jgi:hypothetical protein